MQERANKIGAKLELSSEALAGTCISLTLPT
jgi:signal transduction histidine kinase